MSIVSKLLNAIISDRNKRPERRFSRAPVFVFHSYTGMVLSALSSMVESIFICWA